MQVRSSSAQAQAVASPEIVGTVRRFGRNGVLYEVVKILDGRRALIRVLDTSEETPYAIEKILADPTD